MNKIKGCIFDLDGVICDTAKYHYRAWKKLANELGFDINEEDNGKLNDLSRTESLKYILAWGGIGEKDEEILNAMTEKKNDLYLEFISRMTPDEVFVGVKPFLDSLKKKSIKIALVSVSKNALSVVEKIGLTHYFDALIDGNKITRSKPDAEIFLLGAEAMGINPNECIVFDDSAKGIEAALEGNFYTVGVGDHNVLDEAHIVIPNFEYIDYSEICDALSASIGSLK